MATDRYTKIVLTIIAASLVWLCIVLTPMGTRLIAADTQSNAKAPFRSEVFIAGWIENDGTNGERPVTFTTRNGGIPVQEKKAN
jgi:hypothetical protein